MIVTDGLIGYWHHSQGFNGSTWDNIAPNTQGQYDFNVNGAIQTNDGIYFDDVDDNAETQDVVSGNSATFEAIGRVNSISPMLTATFLGRGGTGISLSDLNSFGMGKGFLNPVSQKLDLIPFNFVENTDYFFHININNVTKTASIYVNNQLIGQRNFSTFVIGNTILGINNTGHGTTSPLTVKSARYYNRSLSEQERTQNYQNGTSVGLEDEQPEPTDPPSVTIANISKTKISDETGHDTSTITFTFDTDVTEWTVNVLGTSHDSGTVADSGGTVSANTEITAEIDWTELQQEGQNRVNIYGYNGEWTAYEGS